ncbi:hypothetical protein BH10ACI2_BH10ACI2_12270 [soil metagenome]
MTMEKLNKSAEADELPDNWWYRVYIGVMISLVMTITALWLFSRYFSS